MNFESIIWIYILLIILACIIPVVRTISIKKKIRKLSDNALEVTPEEFFRIRNASNGGRGKKHISTQHDFAGVYILYNNTKNMYYVGQGKKVFQRVNNHFIGHGNGDVYADYKYGDKFTIKMIALENSGFTTLNELERNTIATYNAYAKGYNKTRGNRG
jgi:GIY-YIG catalytic domain.